MHLTGRDGSFSINLQSADKGPFTACWMTGANNQRLTAGVLHRESVGPSYRKELIGSGTYELTPWLAIHRNGVANDGLFVALDSFFDRWTLTLNREPNRPFQISAGVPLKSPASKLAPGASIVLPTVTMGVFHRDLDDMAARLYAWQYEYLWDYTHDDWFALMPWTVETWYGDTNLQQQFAGRLAHSDADTVDLLRECGMELVWNDAGWAADQNIWAGNLDGPDYAESLRYCDKFGMKRVIWIPGNRTPGELNTKVGAWGNFQWRSDGRGQFRRQRTPCSATRWSSFSIGFRVAPSILARAERRMRTPSIGSATAIFTTTPTGRSLSTATPTSLISISPTSGSTIWRRARRRGAG